MLPIETRRCGWRYLVVVMAAIAIAQGMRAASSGAVPKTVSEANPVWPRPVQPPAGAPNIIIVLVDDVGFGQLGSYGSPLATPNVDRLASGGLRYTNFNVLPVCTPTRAALLTGRNAHSVGLATITEFANGFSNSRGGISRNAATVAEVLRARGYGTSAVGKWHLIPQHEQNPASPPDNWPTGRGFDRFYGYLGGDTSHFAPDLFQDRHRIDPPATLRDGSPYFLDADLTDRAISYISDHRASAPANPFFLYLAYCAGHAPHHAPDEYLKKWRGRFDHGWDEVRAATLARQKEMGLVPADVVLPPHNPGVKPWATLSADERRVYARYYEAFAANLEYTDRQLGRLIDYLERIGQLRDTLIVLMSDNGASPEGGEFGLWNEMQLFNAQQGGTLQEGVKHYDDMGSPLTFGTYPLGWTQAGNTPFRSTKGFVDAGGVRVPLIYHWPARIERAGEIRPQFHFVTDVTATLLDVARIQIPETFNGIPQLPLHGVSMAYSWDRVEVPTTRPTQYFEIYGRRAIQHGDWKAIARHRKGEPYESDAWELYNIKHDFAEARDVAAQHPAKVAELRAIWDREAETYGVFPLDDRTFERDLLRPPEMGGDQTHFVYFPPLEGLHKGTAPDLRGRSFTVSASIVRPDVGAGGVIVAQGGWFCGYSLWVRDGRLVFDYNVSGLERTTIQASTVLPTGACDVAMEFTLAPPPNRGADVKLRVNGTLVAQSAIPRAMPGMISHEPLDFGADTQTAVTDAYRAPHVFRGRVDRVEFQLLPVGR